MPEPGVPTVLIDGPAAGQFLYTDPATPAWYVREPINPIHWSPSADLTHCILPEYVLYRFEQRTACLEVRGSLEPAFVRLRIGWSEPGEPDEDAIRRHGRAALLEHPELVPPGARIWPADPRDGEPIQIADTGSGPTLRCADHLEFDPERGEMRGACPCGWRTEWVPRRRFEELQGLAQQHIEAAIAWLYTTGLYTTGGAVSRSVLRDAAFREALGVLNPANRRASEEAPECGGEYLTASDANWPSQGQTCAHVCGGGADHTCDAKATMHLTYALPSGGKRRMPICGPCHASETTAIPAAGPARTSPARAARARPVLRS